MSRARAPGTFKYKPGPVPTKFQRAPRGPRPPRWTHHDENGGDAKGGIARVWRYVAGRVERTPEGFAAFLIDEQLGTFETLSAACAAVEARYK